MAFASNFGRILSPTFQPNSQAKKAGGRWWDLDGTITSCIAAYQPKGAASYAASKVNLANPGTYDLTNGNDPSWSASTGWTFDGVDDHLYETTYKPTDTSFTIIVRLNNMKIDHSVSSAILSIRRPSSSSESNWALKFEQYDNTGKVGISSWGNPGEYYKDLVSNFASPTGQDVIIAFTRSGTAIKYYVGTNTQTASATFVFDATYKGLVVGAYFSPNFSGDVPKGDLYALSYYHAALSDDQISSISTAMNAL
jgi:hypothetical protein